MAIVEASALSRRASRRKSSWAGTAGQCGGRCRTGRRGSRRMICSQSVTSSSLAASGSAGGGLVGQLPALAELLVAGGQRGQVVRVARSSGRRRSARRPGPGTPGRGRRARGPRRSARRPGRPARSTGRPAAGRSPAQRQLGAQVVPFALPASRAARSRASVQVPSQSRLTAPVRQSRTAPSCRIRIDRSVSAEVHAAAVPLPAQQVATDHPGQRGAGRVLGDAEPGPSTSITLPEYTHTSRSST